MRRLLPFALLALALVLASAVAAEDEERPPFEDFARAPDPDVTGGPDAELYRRGVALQAKGRYRAARKHFLDLIESHPESPFAPEAFDRSGPNAFLGYTLMHEPRPSETRIDVVLMGDGYLLDRQDRFNKDAAGHVKVFLKEPTFSAYERYFNFWRFNLASQDTGVDEVERIPLEEDDEERARRLRRKRKLRTYETALDCKAAGPAGQVMANATCVWHYLTYLDANDGLALCFAKKGELGMGGGGIATTAPRGVVVHEFGHAFTGLLDEYAIHAGKPFGAVNSANTSGDQGHLAWQHFLDAKYPGVGIYEGGATYKKGVWRPAASCAMNTGGSHFCPVCREATVLRIYEYVSPIDAARPEEREVQRGEEGWPLIEVVPMRPTLHDLDVTWYVSSDPADAKAVEEQEEEDDELEDAFLTDAERRRMRRRRAERGTGPAPPREEAPPPRRILKRAWRREGTANHPRPPGARIRGRRRTEKGVGRVHGPVLPELPTGRHLLTVVVRDPVRPRGSRHPWVLKDERGLLEDRRAWILVVP